MSRGLLVQRANATLLHKDVDYDSEQMCTVLRFERHLPSPSKFIICRKIISDEPLNEPNP